MTALIKSTDGSGWVEARVGDVVEYIITVPGWVNTRYTVKGEDGKGFLTCTDGAELLAEHCQLIERPFQVGDEIEGDEANFPEWFGNSVVIETEEQLGWFKNPANGKYRHSSPLLRPVGGV